MQFFAYNLGCLAFLGTDSLADHLPPGIIGDGLLIGERPPLEPGYLWPRLRRGADLCQQSRLAKTRFADHRHERAAPLAPLVQLVVHKLEFGSAAYQRRGQSLETPHLAWQGLGSKHLVGHDGRRLAFDHRPAARPQFEELLDEVIGISADEHRTWFGGALQPRGYVRSVAHRRVFRPDLVPDGGEHREARVDSHAHLEVDPVIAPDRLGVFAGGRLDIQTRTYRTFRIVFVCDRRSEKGEDRVTQQPRYSPIVFLDRRVEEGKRAIHDLRDLLGVEPLAEPGRIDHVGEQYRHVLAFAFHPNLNFELVTAVQAELCALGIGHLAAGTVHFNASLGMK